MDISKITVNAQSSIMIDIGKKIYFDPYDIDEATYDADYIFLTHDHYEHMSIPDIHKILNVETTFVLPVALESLLRRSTTIGAIKRVIPGQEYETNDFTFKTIPSYNITKPFHPKSAGYVGYVINIEGTTIYIPGDTDATKEAEEVKCDIAIVPVGGKFTMDYIEAAELVNKIKPKYAIPTHYGTIVGEKTDGDSFKKLVDKDIQVEIKLSF